MSGGRLRNDAAAIPASTDRTATPRQVQVEFAVDVATHDDLVKVEKSLLGQGIRVVASDWASKTIQLEIGTASSSASVADDTQHHHQPGKQQSFETINHIQSYIEKQIGFLAVLKGVGELRSAVAELDSSRQLPCSAPRARGIVRLSQVTDGYCYVDALVDGFQLDRPPSGGGSCISLAIHELGDLSAPDQQSIGMPIKLLQSNDVQKQLTSVAVQRFVPDCNVADMIGRAVALTEQSSLTDSLPAGGRVLSAGVVARASTVGNNKKQICSCSGKTLWQEREEKKDGRTT